MGENKINRNRRKVLKIATSSPIALSGIPGSASASTTQFKGVAYDTLTQEPIGPVRGNIKETTSGYNGSVNIAGFSVPLEKLNFASKNPDEKYIATLDDDRFKNDDLPLKFIMSKHSHPNKHFSGTITRPSGQFGRIGYFLTSDSDVNVEELVEVRTKRKGLSGTLSSQSVPKKGIPRETGSTHLLNQLGGESQ